MDQGWLFATLLPHPDPTNHRKSRRANKRRWLAVADVLPRFELLTDAPRVISCYDPLQIMHLR